MTQSDVSNPIQTAKALTLLFMGFLTIRLTHSMIGWNQPAQPFIYSGLPDSQVNTEVKSLVNKALTFQHSVLKNIYSLTLGIVNAGKDFYN